MFIVIRAIFILALLLITLLFGCATPTLMSADIATQEPHPSPINNFQIVDADGVYRSGQPKGEADWNYLKNIGITTVIKLNKYSSDVDEAEEFRMAKERNIKVIPIYMQPEDFPHNLWIGVKPDSKDLMQAVKALEENRGNGKKVLVHCSHGKDRTGLVVAIYSVINKNYCKCAAYEEMKQYGTSPILFGLKPMLDSPDIREKPDCTYECK
jgi:protein tyrosine/serine phosphatase